MIKITEDYVSFELAKLLDEKGFDIVTNCSYYIGSSDEYVCKYGDLIGHPAFHYDKFISAPTHQRAMKWLREIHKIHVEIWPTYDTDTDEHTGWGITVSDLSDFGGVYLGDASGYKTYEEAVEVALKTTLENFV